MKTSFKNDIVEFIETWRISRVLMLTFITVSTAWGFRASAQQLVLTAVTAFFLALGGFYMDHLADADHDRRSKRGRNPVASGSLPKKAGLTVVILSLSTAIITGFILDPLILIPVASVILVLFGLSSGFLKHPFFKALSLGVLQALYAVVGALAAKHTGIPLVLVSLFLILAMTGGRVLGDIRDMPFDKRTSSVTIPIKYGIRFSILFYIIFELGCYAVGIGGFFTGFFGRGYLICMILTAVIGTAISVYFIRDPSPKRADLANRLSLLFLGTLYAAGMLTGRL